MAKYACQMVHARTCGTGKHAPMEYPASTIIRYSTLTERDQINNDEMIETTTGIDVTMIDITEIGGMIIITAIEIEIDIDQTRAKAEDVILKVVIEADDTLALIGATEETTQEAVTDEAQLHNET